MNTESSPFHSRVASSNHQVDTEVSSEAIRSEKEALQRIFWGAVSPSICLVCGMHIWFVLR